jgi:hypothetical protein
MFSPYPLTAAVKNVANGTDSPNFRSPTLMANSQQDATLRKSWFEGSASRPDAGALTLGFASISQRRV